MTEDLFDLLDQRYVHRDDFCWEHAEIGDVTFLFPHPGEAAADTALRMKKIATAQAKLGRHFVVRHTHSTVTIKRTKPAFNTRLGEFLEIEVGEYSLFEPICSYDAARYDRIVTRLNRSGMRELDTIHDYDSLWIYRSA